MALSAGTRLGPYEILAPLGAAEDKVYRRVVRRRGVFPWKVVALPRPQL